jgi:hypothetical protein
MRLHINLNYLLAIFLAALLTAALLATALDVAVGLAAVSWN